MKFSLQLMAVALLCSFVACKNNDTSESKEVLATTQYNTPKAEEATTVDSTAPSPPSTFAKEQADQPGQPNKPEHQNQIAPSNTDWDKKIIKNASLIVDVKDHKSFSDLVHGLVKQSGGYVAEEEQTKTDYKIEKVVTIKVPVDQFDNLVTALTSTKDNVIEQKITSQDVTGEVIDTRSRTEAKQQVRARYLELLKQAKNMDEILKVQKEINDIQVEIEAGSGRVNYLNHAAAFSTVQLTFYEILNAAAEHEEKPGFGTRVLSALQSGFDWIGEMLIVLLTLWPLWLFLGGAWYVFKKVRKSVSPKVSK